MANHPSPESHGLDLPMPGLLGLVSVLAVIAQPHLRGRLGLGVGDRRGPVAPAPAAVAEAVVALLHEDSVDVFERDVRCLWVEEVYDGCECELCGCMTGYGVVSWDV